MAVKKKINQKKIAQQKHAIRRLSEKDRYGIEIDDIIYRQLCNSIRFLGKSYKEKKYNVELLEKVSNTRSVYKIFYGENTLIAVYDGSRGSIVTFLSKDCRECRRN